MALEQPAGRRLARREERILRVLTGLFFLALAPVVAFFGLAAFVQWRGENTPPPTTFDTDFEKVWGACAMADGVICLAAALCLFAAVFTPKTRGLGNRAGLVAIAIALLLYAALRVKQGHH